MGRYFDIGNPPIRVDVRQNARARRLSLRVSRLDGKISLTMPARASEREALAFLTDREDWLRGHLADVRGAQVVASGTVLPYRGDQLTIAEGPVPRPVIDDGALILPERGGPVGPRVRAFLRAQARDVLAARSDIYAARVGRSYQKLSIRDTRSRWGSCTAQGGLMYSWRLIMAPPAVLDYVAAHEVAHLVELNHSRAFWDVVAGLMPDYARHRAWLRGEGMALHRFVFD